jgi:hypothetical protein
MFEKLCVSSLYDQLRAGWPIQLPGDGVVFSCWNVCQWVRAMYTLNCCMDDNMARSKMLWIVNGDGGGVDDVIRICVSA